MLSHMGSGRTSRLNDVNGGRLTYLQGSYTCTFLRVVTRFSNRDIALEAFCSSRALGPPSLLGHVRNSILWEFTSVAACGTPSQASS